MIIVMTFILMTSCQNGGTFEKNENTATVRMDGGPRTEVLSGQMKVLVLTEEL